MAASGRNDDTQSKFFFSVKNSNISGNIVEFLPLKLSRLFITRCKQHGNFHVRHHNRLTITSSLSRYVTTGSSDPTSACMSSWNL